MLFVVLCLVGATGVCKINGVVIVVDCRYSIGLSTTNNKNTVYFANLFCVCCVVVLVVVLTYCLVLVLVLVGVQCLFRVCCLLLCSV